MLPPLEDGRLGPRRCSAVDEQHADDVADVVAGSIVRRLVDGDAVVEQRVDQVRKNQHAVHESPHGVDVVRRAEVRCQVRVPP